MSASKDSFNFSVNLDLKSDLTDIYTEYMDFNYKIFFNVEFCKTLIQKGIGCRNRFEKFNKTTQYDDIVKENFTIRAIRLT